MHFLHYLYESCLQVLKGALLAVTGTVMFSEICLYMQLESQSKYFRAKLKT